MKKTPIKKIQWLKIKDDLRLSYMFTHYTDEQIAINSGLSDQVIWAIRLSRDLTKQEQSKINVLYRKVMYRRLKKEAFNPTDARRTCSDKPKAIKAAIETQREVIQILGKGNRTTISNIRKGVAKSERFHDDWEQYIEERRNEGWIPRLWTKNFQKKNVQDYYHTEALEGLRTMKMKREPLSRKNILAWDNNQEWQTFFTNIDSIDLQKIRKYLKK